MRIIDLWFVGVADKSKQAEMVMVDSNGDEIHVVCKQDQLKAWKMDLKEIVLMSCTILGSSRMMANTKFVITHINWRLLELPLLGSVNWMVCLLKNTYLHNLAMSFLASSNLVYWLVSPARFPRLILESTSGQH
ncbi:hypothetical protein GYH30_040166 [Glycine max]|nr:hypothetical protein GYH30_040166 [Glycine max]